MKTSKCTWSRKVIPIALLAAGWSAQALAAQHNAAAGQVVNLPGLTWDNTSTTVLESDGAGAVINVNGPVSQAMNSVMLFDAKNGGSIALNHNGLPTSNSIAITNGRLGELNGAGSLLIDYYHLTVDNSASRSTDPIVELELSLANNEIRNTSVEYDGGGGAAFIKTTASNLTLTNNWFEVDNSGGALVIMSKNGQLSNITIDGGRYYGSNNLDYFPVGNSSAATVDVGGGSTLAVRNNALIQSDAGGNAMHLRWGTVTVDGNSRIIGGKAGVVSSVVGGNLIVNNSEISADQGSAVLVSAKDYAYPTTVPPALTVTGNNTLMTGINGLRVEGRGQLTATLTNNSLIQVDGIGISADRMGEVGIGSSEVTATLQNSRIEASRAFEARNGSELNITLDDSLVRTNDWIDAAAVVSGGSSLTLNSSDSYIYGGLVADSASDTLDANLTKGSTLIGSVTNANRLQLDSSTWQMTGSSSMNTLENLSGSEIILSPPANPSSITDYKTLTVNGNYTGGGAIHLNTWLGDNDSPSDKLIVGGDTSGTTTLHVTNTGGPGVQTTKGIQLVQVGGASNGTFALANRVVSGLYQYDLYQRRADGGWYLSNALDPDPIDPSTGSPGSNKFIATENGVYARNLSAAASMFMQTLHDRIGEPQFTDASKRSGVVPGVWLRVAGSTADSKGGNGQLDLTTDTTVVQLGGDLARWSSNGTDRWHFGVMGGYGRSDIDADNNRKRRTNSGLSNTASGEVEGYSVGAYATWFGNQNKPSGPYVDTWVQYGWFDNEVKGNGRATESYDSDGWTASIEAGYAFVVGQSPTRQWLIEPQVQVAYSSYRADDHRDADGTMIRDGKAEGVVTRLGARFYTRSLANNNAIQPFIETNWWYDGAQGSQHFSGGGASATLDDGGPDNRFELKAGLQGEVAKGWQLWGHVGGQWGKDSYSRYEGMVGLKKLF